jgi:hypothetical protein
MLSKIGGDICKSMCTTGINDIGSKFATGINNTSRKFCHWYRWCCRYWWQIATGINDTAGKFATCVTDTGGK